MIYHPNATDPRSIVKSAIAYVNEQKADNSWKSDDTAWAVFDRDSHDAVNLNDAMQKARSKGIHVVLSNPCFELWYLLHYEDQNSYLDNRQARERLTTCRGKYEKPDKLYSELNDKTHFAIDRAKRLREMHDRDGKQDPEANPVTDAHLLVMALLALEQS